MNTSVTETSRLYARFQRQYPIFPCNVPNISVQKISQPLKVAGIKPMKGSLQTILITGRRKGWR